MIAGVTVPAPHTIGTHCGCGPRGSFVPQLYAHAAPSCDRTVGSVARYRADAIPRLGWKLVTAAPGPSSRFAPEQPAAIIISGSTQTNRRARIRHILAPPC